MVIRKKNERRGYHTVLPVNYIICSVHYTIWSLNVQDGVISALKRKGKREFESRCLRVEWTDERGKGRVEFVRMERVV